MRIILACTQDAFGNKEYRVQLTTELRRMEALFDDSHIFGWAVTDTFCQRVLSELLTRASNPGVLLTCSFSMSTC
jgi:hypothetical protein